MTPEILARVFEPFFTTKEHGKGTGLGLSMVFGFIKQSGGHISVYSEPGIGTTFRLFLPRMTEALQVVEAQTATPLVHGNGETVLVVEDNAALRRVVARQLGELGYGVLEAENAAAGLRLMGATERRLAVDRRRHAGRHGRPGIGPAGPPTFRE